MRLDCSLQVPNSFSCTTRGLNSNTTARHELQTLTNSFNCNVVRAHLGHVFLVLVQVHDKGYKLRRSLRTKYKIQTQGLHISHNCKPLGIAEFDNALSL